MILKLLINNSQTVAKDRLVFNGNNTTHYRLHGFLNMMGWIIVQSIFTPNMWFHKIGCSKIQSDKPSKTNHVLVTKTSKTIIRKAAQCKLLAIPSQNLRVCSIKAVFSLYLTTSAEEPSASNWKHP